MTAASLRTRRLIGAFLAGTLLLAGSAQAGWPADNVALYSHLSLGDLSANFAEDCWGYVSKSGREYAIIGLDTGTQFVEITDPKNPVLTAHIARPRRARDMKVYQDYVYVSFDRGPLDVLDVSDIDNGNVKLVNRIDGGRAHNLMVNPETPFLYVARGGPMEIWSLADPANPVHITTFDVETHDAQIVTYHGGQYDGREIAFIYSGRTFNLIIVDVTDKNNMFELGRETYPGAGYTHLGALSEDRQYAFVSDELDEFNNGTQTTTFVMDVSDLSNPTLVTSFSTGLDSTDHNLYVKGDYLFQANYTSGARIFNVSDPLNAFEVGYFDTFPANNDVGFDGAWTAYPHFPSGTLIVSDRNDGLFVLDVREAVGAGECVRNPAWQCDGDVDGDGQVNPVDSGLVQAAFGSGDDQDLCNYDMDCDGQINPVDSGIVQSLFGTCDEPRSACP